jgi:hypothetical protein
VIENFKTLAQTKKIEIKLISKKSKTEKEIAEYA